jgi:hypothetical protein
LSVLQNLVPDVLELRLDLRRGVKEVGQLVHDHDAGVLTRRQRDGRKRGLPTAEGGPPRASAAAGVFDRATASANLASSRTGGPGVAA